jgi:hypothetical protein
MTPCAEMVETRDAIGHEAQLTLLFISGDTGGGIQRHTTRPDCNMAAPANLGFR